MLKLILISGWLWGFIISRFIIWSRRCKGLLWLPFPNASNWYRMTTLKYRVQHTYLGPLFVYDNIVRIVLLLLLPDDTFLICLMFVINIIINTWWPGFIELKLTFRRCSTIIIVNTTLLCISLYWYILMYGAKNVILLYLILIMTNNWYLWISIYSWLIVKTPTTYIEYNRRESRQPLDV